MTQSGKVYDTNVATVNADKFSNGLQSALDLAINLARRHVDKAGGESRDQFLHGKPIPQDLLYRNAPTPEGYPGAGHLSGVRSTIFIWCSGSAWASSAPRC